MWRVIEEASSRPTTVSDMVSFNVDPQWCGLLFSIYCRHEKASLTGGFPSPDALANCAFQGPPLDADWLALAGTLGFEICRLSDTWALVFESVKATSVIFLLGVGGLVCYKLYHYYWPRPRSPSPDSPGPSSPRTRRKIFTARALGLPLGSEQQLLEPGDEPHYGSVETRYFGPSNPLYEDDSAEGNPYLADQSASTSPSEDSAEDDIHDSHMSEGGLAEKSIHSLRRQRPPWSTPQHSRHDHRGSSLGSSRAWSWRRARHAPISPLNAREHPRTLPTDNPGWLLKRIGSVVSPGDHHTLPLRKGASLPATPGKRVRNVVEPRKVQTACQFAEWQQSGRQAPEGAESTTRCRSIPRSDPPATMDSTTCSSSKINRDISLDSLGFSDNGSCYGGYENMGRRFPREGSFDSTCSELSIDFSLKETMDTATMACMEQLQKEIDQLKTNCLMMDEEFETIKCNRNVPGMSSLMKATDHNNQINDSEDVVAENDPIKSEETARACFAGLYSLTTIKNSTSSELSDSALMSYRHGSIGSAESLEWDSPKVITPVKLCLNDAIVSPVHKIKEELDKTLCEHKLTSTMKDTSTPVSIPDKRERSISTQASSDVLALSEDELMANLEWDNEDLTQYPDISGDITADGEPNLLACVDTLEMDLEAELAFKDEGTPRNRSEEPESALDSFTSTSRSCTTSPTTERSLGEGSSSVNTNLVASPPVKTHQQKHLLSLPTLEQAKPWAQWSSEESGFMEWDATAESQKTSSSQDTASTFAYGWADLSSPTVSGVSSSEQVSPDSEVVGDMLSPSTPSMDEASISTPGKQLNVGHRATLLQYATKEWQGQTTKAQNVLKGYAEIPAMLGLEHIRPIRGDNYCAVRATIFQSLVQGIPVPSGQATFSRLSHAIDSGSQWIQNWQFANRLPYCGNNVLHGMRVCLESLDNMASLLVNSSDRETTLAHMLNSDSGLDLHVVEAVKLHMLACAMQLYDANCTGSQDVPLFAVLMFARDTSETPRDLMNNHLQAVGNTGGLEQVEMFLLGYALGVTVRVVRPIAYGTEDFVCNFPDLNEDKWPQVVLIAEDDRHYNVLL